MSIHQQLMCQQPEIQFVFYIAKHLNTAFNDALTMSL